MALIRAAALLYIIHTFIGYLVLATEVGLKRQSDETELENVSHALDTATGTVTSTISTTLTITQSPTRTTLGYYSGSEYMKDGITTTVWDPFDLSSVWYTTTTNNYFHWVKYGSIASNSTNAATALPTSYSKTETSDTDPIFTDCSFDTLYGIGSQGTTSFDCKTINYACVHYVVRSEYGLSTGALTSYDCLSSASGMQTETTLYRTRPDSVGLPHATAPSTARPGLGPSTSTTSTSSPASNAPTGNSHDTGIIAGSVVAGIAVLAITGIAVLWILKRGRNGPDAAPSASAPSIHTEEGPWSHIRYDGPPVLEFPHNEVVEANARRSLMELFGLEIPAELPGVWRSRMSE